MTLVFLNNPDYTIKSGSFDSMLSMKVVADYLSEITAFNKMKTFSRVETPSLK